MRFLSCRGSRSSRRGIVVSTKQDLIGNKGAEGGTKARRDNVQPRLSKGQIGPSCQVGHDAGSKVSRRIHAGTRQGCQGTDEGTDANANKRRHVDIAFRRIIVGMGQGKDDASQKGGPHDFGKKGPGHGDGRLIIIAKTPRRGQGIVTGPDNAMLHFVLSNFCPIHEKVDPGSQGGAQDLSDHVGNEFGPAKFRCRPQDDKGQGNGRINVRSRNGTDRGNGGRDGKAPDGRDLKQTFQTVGDTGTHDTAQSQKQQNEGSNKLGHDLTTQFFPGFWCRRGGPLRKETTPQLKRVEGRKALFQLSLQTGTWGCSRGGFACLALFFGRIAIVGMIILGDTISITATQGQRNGTRGRIVKFTGRRLCLGDRLVLGIATHAADDDGICGSRSSCGKNEEKNKNRQPEQVSNPPSSSENDWGTNAAAVGSLGSSSYQPTTQPTNTDTRRKMTTTKKRV